VIVALDVESQQHFLPKFLRLGMAFDSNFARYIVAWKEDQMLINIRNSVCLSRAI
jgi:hypothetical protein